MRRIALFISYVWVTTLAGLAIHPYQSVRRMVFDREKRILLPVVLTPLFSLAAFFIVGRVGSYFFDFSGMAREVVSLFLGWFLIGILLWQAFVVALVIRFVRGILR